MFKYFLSKMILFTFVQAKLSDFYKNIRQNIYTVAAKIKFPQRSEKVAPRKKSLPPTHNLVASFFQTAVEL